LFTAALTMPRGNARRCDRSHPAGAVACVALPR